MHPMKAVLALLPWLAVVCPTPVPADDSCVVTGRWIDPASGAVRPSAAWMRDLAGRPAVLVGESHDNAEHHRWQLDVLAGLHAVNPNMVVGFEAFPRRVQPVLDRWVAGDLGDSEFLREVEWGRVWGFAADLYLPLFHFARRHKVPMVALNVDISLIRRVRGEGWAAIPVSERRGVGEPAAADPAYVARLREVFEHHERMRAARQVEPDATAPTSAEERLNRFLEAQVLWDRAMAEAVASAHEAGQAPLVVGILGSGHLEGGHGVPRQLSDLGFDGAAVVVPWNLGRDCDDLKPGLADAVFGLVDPPRPAPPLKLGVYITDGADGVNIKGVFPDSTADRSGLRTDDVVLSAAGREVRKADELKAVIAEMVPGVWLPLKVRRGGETLDLIARFPTEQ